MVSVRNTLSRMRRTPAVEHRRLARLGVVPLDHPHAPERLREPARDLGVHPAALAEDRPQRPKAPGRARGRRRRATTSVSSGRCRGLSCSITRKAAVAVRSPPASSMRPVPTRFRRPSTSLMIRETRSPVLFASWYATGRRPTCCCTRTRMSAMSCCAAFETSWARAKELSPCTTVAATTAPTRGSSSSTWRPPDHVVDQELGRGRQDEAGHAAHGHQHEGDGQQPPARLHERPDVGQQGAQPLGLAAPGGLPRQPGRDPSGSPHLRILPW